jgi:probable rRNA maturation factor
VTVNVSTTVERSPLDEGEVERTVEASLEHGGRAGLDVDVVLVDDAHLQGLHQRFLGDERPTDVMAFDLGEDGGGPAAEIYVSVDCAVRVAARRGVAVARELALYLVHGTLHLCGHDDHDPSQRARMRAAEVRVLDALGYERDALPHDE